MEAQFNSFDVTNNILHHTLRCLCIQENSPWVYSVFWRILPRYYPQPKLNSQGHDMSMRNKRNWMLVWEDGFSGFGFQPYIGLQPELFFKMTHEIYNYGEGLIGKVAADDSYKWIFNEPTDHEINNSSSAWHNSADTQPKTWEAQFQSGIKTIALIATREGVIQLGSFYKVIEDMSHVIMVRMKLSGIQSLPGVLRPSPSSIPPAAVSSCQLGNNSLITGSSPIMEQQPFQIDPSMSSLEALLSRLPPVIPPAQQVILGGQVSRAVCTTSNLIEPGLGGDWWGRPPRDRRDKGGPNN